MNAEDIESMIKKIFLIQFALSLMGLMLGAGPVWSEDQKPAVSEAVKNIDPGRPKSKLFLRTEFKKSESGKESTIVEPLYEFPVGDKWTVRLQVPMISSNPVSGTTDTGLGDITTRFTYKAFSAGGFTFFVGPEFKWNTATDSTLGSNENQISPTIFAFKKITEWNLFLFPELNHFESLGSGTTSYTAFKPKAMKKLSDGYYLFFEPAIFVDHDANDQSTGTFELEYGRFVDPSLMVYGRPGGTLWGDNTAFSFNWNFEVGFRKFF
jgi:hypothetical protein